MKSTIAILALSVLILSGAGCKKTTTGIDPNMLLGTWVNQVVDNQTIPASQAYVMEFKSTGTEVYAIGYQINDSNSLWISHSTYVWDVNGDNINIVGSDVFGATYAMQFHVLSLTDKQLTFDVPAFEVNGVPVTNDNTYTCDLVTEDLKGELTGTWYGRCVSDSCSNTTYHYLDFFSDGSYNYYYLDGEGNWACNPDNDGQWYLYGTFLATNYNHVLPGGNLGSRNENWNISIDGDKMTYSALLEDNYTVIYEMDRVDGPPATN